MRSSGITFIRVLIAIFVFFALIVVGYQIYKYNFDSLKIESAVMGEIEETVNATGLFFRNEKTILRKNYEYMDVIRAEAERISNGGVIARIYDDQESAILQKEIRQVRERIETYETVLENSGSYKSASVGIDETIYNDLRQISYSVGNEKSSAAFGAADNLIVNVMKHKIAAGDLVSYDATLAELREKLETLQKHASGSSETILSEKSGYFSYGTDGLEESFDPDILQDFSSESFNQKLSEAQSADQQTENAIGKIVYNNSWYVVLKTSAKSVEELEEGGTVYIRIPTYGTQRIKCSVVSLKKEGDQALLVLNSSVITGNILTLRAEEVKLILHTYSGVQVRQSALRKVDGKDGVFVKVGLLLRYKEVEILYNDGINALVAYDAVGNGGVRLYDQVVYKGSNLYDGKAVS